MKLFLFWSLSCLDEALRRLGFIQLIDPVKKRLEYCHGSYHVVVYPTTVLRIPMLKLLLHKHISPYRATWLIRGSNRLRTQKWYGPDLEDLFRDISLTYTRVMQEELTPMRRPILDVLRRP